MARAKLSTATKVMTCKNGKSRRSIAGVKDLYERLAIDRDTLEALARAEAFDSLQERRDALYQIGALVHTQSPAVQPLSHNLSVHTTRFEPCDEEGCRVPRKAFSFSSEFALHTGKDGQRVISPPTLYQTR